MDALKLTFVNGETILAPFSEDSTLTIDTPDGVNGVKRGAWGEIANVEYVKDVSPTVLDPTVSNVPPSAPDAPADPFASPLAAPAAETQPIEQADPNAPPADPSLLQKVEAKLGLGHDAAVATAQTDVEIASTNTADDPAAHLQAAIADVDAALAAYPDSTQLQDAKAQLELLAAPPTEA